MKHELNTQPDSFKETWEGQYRIFSWIEYVTAIPQSMSVITTWKESRIPNACLQAWTMYAGDSGGYYVTMAILERYHTYENILRDKEFVMNFPDKAIFPQCFKTIENNDSETDEITAVGLTAEPSQVVNAPRIKECFLNLECRLGWHHPLHEGSIWHIFAGEVMHVAIDGNYTESGKFKRYGENGFIFNIHCPTDPVTGKQDDSMVGIIEPVQKI